MILLLVSGCMSLDGFFFDPLAVDQYTFAGDVPAELVEEVSFESGDGTTLYGAWAHQPEEDRDGAPVLVFFHGNADNMDRYWDRMGTLWALGYEAFAFDYRGYGRSDGAPTWNGVLIDGTAAVDFVTAETGLNPEQVRYLGLSLGGAVAIHTSVGRSPGALVAEATFANAEMLLDDGSGMDLASGWVLESEFDNLDAVDDVGTGILIAHGADDDYVRPAHAQALYDAAADPKELWLVEGAGHDDIPDEAPVEYATRLVEWFDPPAAEE